MAKRRRIIPLKRTLKRGAVGPDCRAVKRALIRAKCYDPPPKGKRLTNQFGRFAVNGVKAFQRKVRIPADGVYGPRTHKKLLPYFDSYGAFLMGRAPAPQLGSGRRQAVVNEATWCYNRRGWIHYSMARPIPARYAGHRLPQTMDCSGFATMCYKRAGASDPNGMGYSGYGWTGTLCVHGRSVSLAAARPGDLVFYGQGYPYTHVAVYVGHNRVISHGSEGGPYLLNIDYRNDRRIIRSYLP
jgi:NlpC/P60 family/Putative peptidoglycan binding domain